MFKNIVLKEKLDINLLDWEQTYKVRRKEE